jgi:hypothetical protein
MNGRGRGVEAGRGLWGASGSVPLRMLGADGAEPASHHRVTGRRPKSELLPPWLSFVGSRKNVGMGAGKREAPRPRRGHFKGQHWEGQSSGAVSTWPLLGWAGRGAP